MHNVEPLDVWEKQRKQWGLLSSPLRPTKEDVRIYNHEISTWVGPQDKALTALILGVTPELPALHWPQGSTVYGLDRSMSMIHSIWPRQVAHASGCIAMDWLAVPLAPGCADMILGDGSFSLVSWPDGYINMLGIIEGLLKPGGRLLVRFFTRSGPDEDCDIVFDDLMNGRIGSFHAFKWRLAMAIQGANPDGVVVSDIWKVWHSKGITDEQVASRNNWPIEVVGTINAYRDAGQVLTFPQQKKLRELLARRMNIKSFQLPEYELGERCPIIAMESR